MDDLRRIADEEAAREEARWTTRGRLLVRLAAWTAGVLVVTVVVCGGVGTLASRLSRWSEVGTKADAPEGLKDLGPSRVPEERPRASNPRRDTP